jgi:D-glycero-beta-D-manno-heptose-7-phosphate kinase
MTQKTRQSPLFTEELANTLFDQFRHKRVLVIGDVMLDAYLWGNVERISPEAPVPVVAVNRRSSKLGGAANVAINLKALGAEPQLCAVIGNDARGVELIQLMIDEGLDCSCIMTSDSRCTTTKFRIFGNRTQMLRVDEEVTDHLNSEDLIDFLQMISQKLESSTWDVIIFQDYDKGLLDADIIAHVMDIAKQRAIPVAVDPKRRNFFNYHGVTLFKPNMKEFAEGFAGQYDLNKPDQFLEAVNRLHAEQQIGMVLVTLSSEGVFISDHGQSVRLPAHVRQVADVSGAGDTVISVAALGLACDLQAEQLAALGNLAGGLVCEEVGVSPVNRDKLLNELLQKLT